MLGGAVEPKNVPIGKEIKEKIKRAARRAGTNEAETKVAKEPQEGKEAGLRRAREPRGEFASPIVLSFCL